MPLPLLSSPHHLRERGRAGEDVFERDVQERDVRERGRAGEGRERGRAAEGGVVVRCRAAKNV